MNERIQELAERAGFNLIRENCYDVVSTMLVQEFAELIVRECAEHLLHDVKLTDIQTTRCVASIKEHFGVEE